MRNEVKCEAIVDSVLATNGVTTSHILAYEKKRAKNRSRKHHSSQDAVNMYTNGHETESVNSM